MVGRGRSELPASRLAIWRSVRIELPAHLSQRPGPTRGVGISAVLDTLPLLRRHKPDLSGPVFAPALLDNLNVYIRPQLHEVVH